MSSSPRSIHLIGFTPLSVILAEHLSFRGKHLLINLVDQTIIDDQWESVDLLCLIHLLKQCRILISNHSNNFGIHLKSIHIDQTNLQSSIQSARKTVQQFYSRLLKQRRINMTELDDKNATIYNTYTRSAHADFPLRPRLNIFDYIFHSFPSDSSLKFLGNDLGALELAHLVSHLCPNEIYFYRMNPHQSLLLSSNETNARLETLIEIFAKSTHPSVVQRGNLDKDHCRLHVIEEFQIHSNNDGALTFERIVVPTIPLTRTANDLKNEKRTYLKTFRQRSQLELSSSNLQMNLNRTVSSVVQEDEHERLDLFPIDSTFLILPDRTNVLDSTIPSRSTSSQSIGKFSHTASSMIKNIYETLRNVSEQFDSPNLTDLLLSIDHELCILHRSDLNVDQRQCKEKIFESALHNLQHPIENLHDMYKIIQRSIDVTTSFSLYESQIFQNDALDLQSLLLFFDANDEIPSNELLFLFTDEQNWYDELILPDSISDFSSFSTSTQQ